MYPLTNNVVERLKVSSIQKLFDNRIYESNHQNDDSDDLPFDGYERLITRQRLYCIHDNIVFKLKLFSSVGL